MKKDQWTISVEQLVEWKTALDDGQNLGAATVSEQIQDILSQMGKSDEKQERSYFIVATKDHHEAEYGWILVHDPSTCQFEKDYLELIDDIANGAVYTLEHTDVLGISVDDYMSISEKIVSGEDVSQDIAQIIDSQTEDSLEYYLVHEPESEFFGYNLWHSPITHVQEEVNVEVEIVVAEASAPTVTHIIPLKDLTRITREEFEEIRVENEVAGDPNAAVERILAKYYDYLDLTITINQCKYSLYRSLDEVASSLVIVMEKQGYTLEQVKVLAVFQHVSYHDVTYIYRKVEELLVQQ